MSLRIHILGASGSGTTTLARELARVSSITHLDTDDFYWAPSDIPFTIKRPVPERLALLEDAFTAHEQWVLSGSLCSWGDSIIPMFTHVVFLYIPWDVREQRLMDRERQRYSSASLQPGGTMHEVHVAFMEWASRYDDAGLEQRSYAMHDRWLIELPAPCRVLRVEKAMELGELTRTVVEWIRTAS
jgi:adenylate kinase family enzyme